MFKLLLRVIQVANHTSHIIAKEVCDMKITKKLNDKLTEKKLYQYVLKKNVIFNVGVMTALGILGEENRELVGCGDSYVRFNLIMDIEQKTGIDLAVRDYLVNIVTYTEKDKKSKVWK